MSTINYPDIDRFIFHGLHHRIRIGTATDRYAGWIGQIYTPERYKISKRNTKVGNKSFTEEILPLESVGEYFQHFSVLEIDFTFYRPLLNKDLQPTSSYRILQGYQKYLNNDDRLILKVPQVITARRLRRSGDYTDNPNYLYPETFIHQFYDPANAVSGDQVVGFIFEQEYHRKKDRLKVDQLASEIDTFFKAIPGDKRYHLELRTEDYLREPVFDVMRNHRVGQVLSHWTWLPRLLKQFAKAGNRFTNPDHCIVRLLTPLGMRYNESYVRAFPFDRMVDGMLQPEMIPETVSLMKLAIEKGIHMSVIVNNRAGGNAPLIAQELVTQFVK